MTKQNKTEKKDIQSKSSIKTSSSKKKNSSLSKLPAFLNSKASIGVICLLMGVGLTLLIQNYSNKNAKEAIYGNNKIEELLLNPFNFVPLQELDALNRRMEERFDYLDSYFDNFIKIEPTSYTRQASSSQNEDDDFIYYQINFDGYDKEDISIKIENSQLMFSAKTSQSNEDKENSSKQFMSSNFLYSFRLPSNIYMENPEIIKEDNKIIVKFKKQSIADK
ncbi:MAG: Hsp20/alpha crystallin family protein [Rickettsiales bacterium]|jgi:HSP20 family molecular chaperone IbpA|nr:Hsp20/alpha crystallin family protein [Rickettsiales bacterium]